MVSSLAYLVRVCVTLVNLRASKWWCISTIYHVQASCGSLVRNGQGDTDWVCEKSLHIVRIDEQSGPRPIVNTPYKEGPDQLLEMALPLF